MARIKIQEDFITKANEVHNGYYDYTEVVYVKSSQKVRICCPIHGVFEQTPNKHLSGQGCKLCGRNRTKVGFDEFVRRAREVHGNRYDYSKVVYKRRDVPVTIVCREHGPFEQTPHGHVVLKHNCPKCAAIAGGRKRMDVNNVMRKESVKQKVRDTCLMRYGTKTYAESDVGRANLSIIITSPEVSKRMAETCMERYGAANWSQSDIGREALRELMSSCGMRDKIEQGYMKKYGVPHYMKTDEGREKARYNILLPDHQAAIRAVFPQTWEKICATNLAKYGVKYIGACSWVHEKSWETKRMNGICNTSKPEETLYLLLCDVFGKDDVMRQYNLDVRYPFACDFYIKSLDLFIELNASWTHGGHWFDDTNVFDMQKLSLWLDKSDGLNSKYYENAIRVWTVRDLMKRQCAIDNNLNYLVFWDNDLGDAREWLSHFRM